MPKISPDKLEPGMKLAKPVFRGGMIFLSAGTVLTDQWIRKIEDLDIDGVQIDMPVRQSVSREEMIQNLAKRLKDVEDQPYMDLIGRVMKRHIEGLYE